MSTRPTPANATAAIRPKVTVPAFQEKRRLGQPLAEPRKQFRKRPPIHPLHRVRTDTRFFDDVMD